MPRPPTEPKLDKRERKSLARRLRALLARGPIDMAGIAATLEEPPEAIVVGMRELRQRRGAVRSSIRYGHVVWWWQEKNTEVATPEAPTIDALASLVATAAGPD